MKLPPQFAAAIFPVLLVHIVVIALAGVILRNYDADSANNSADGDGDTALEVTIVSPDDLPSKEKKGNSTAAYLKAADEVDATLFPEQMNLATYLPKTEPGQGADDSFGKPAISSGKSVFEAVRKKSDQSSPQKTGKEKAQTASPAPKSINGEPPPKARQFRPISISKS